GWLYYLGERAITSLSPGAATAVLDGEVYLRAYATFSHPNVLAGYLLISLVFLSFQRSYFRTVLTRVLLLSGMVVGTLGLFVTLSRLPIVLWGCFLLFVLFRSTVRVLFQASTRNPLPFRRII